jgi:Ca2+-binding EF-hand superfamily protein
MFDDTDQALACKELMRQKHTPYDYKNLMQMIDKDLNGRVTWEEFVATATNKIALLNERNKNGSFKILDFN